MEVKAGDLVVAIDPCVMEDDGIAALTVGKEYEIQYDDQHYFVIDDQGHYHVFGADEVEDDGWEFTFKPVEETL